MLAIRSNEKNLNLNRFGDTTASEHVHNIVEQYVRSLYVGYNINERSTNGKCLILIEIFNPLMASSICLKPTSQLEMEARNRNIVNCTSWHTCTSITVASPHNICTTQRIPVNPFFRMSTLSFRQRQQIETEKYHFKIIFPTINCWHGFAPFHIECTNNNNKIALVSFR